MALRSPTAATPHPPRESGSRGPFLLLTLISLLAISLFIVLAFGQVHGLEISPRTLQRRSYTFFQLPLLRVQVTPVWHDDRTDTLEQYLKRQGLLRRSQPPDRWDTAWVIELGRQHEGDPNILARYLDTVDSDEQQVWYRWTTEHPDLASTLWPAVQEAALLHAYVVLPELFQMAAGATDTAAFQRGVEDYLPRRLLALAQEYELAEEHELAVALFRGLLVRDELDPQLRRQIEQLAGPLEDTAGDP